MTATEPEAPQGVRLVLRDGSEIEPIMLGYVGLEDGIHVWHCATLAHPHDLVGVRMGALPARTELRVEFFTTEETP